MNQPWYWLARIGGGLLLTSLGLLLHSLVSPRGALRAHAHHHLRKLKRDLDFLRARISAEQLATAQLVAALLGALAAGLQQWLACVIACALFACPPLVLRSLREKRTASIEQQVEPWLVALANALKASASLGDSLASTATLMHEPIRGEIERIVKEQQLGTPLDQAFCNAGERIGSRSFAMGLTLLRIARNTGGDLSETLSTSAKSLREMARLDGVVRTKTAEGKAQALVVSAIPLPLYFVIEWLHPGFFEPLEHSVTGHVIVAIAGLLWISAAVLAQRILKVDI